MSAVKRWAYSRARGMVVDMSQGDEREPVAANDCAPALMEQAMRLFGDVWILLLVYHLLAGPRRFGELQSAMGNVSPKTISQRLKLLEEAGFLERQAFAEIPPRVEYTLTAKGLALGDVIAAMGTFAQRYLA